MQDYYQYDASFPHCRWWMTLTIPLSMYFQESRSRHLDFNQIIVKGINKEDCLSTIEAWWGITDRTSWIEMIIKLIKGKVHGDELLQELELIHFIYPSQWQEYMNDIDNKQGLVDCQFAEVVYHHCGIGGIRAWDFARAVHLIRYAYTCNLITESETCFLLNQNANQAQYHFKSWRQYSISCNLGRSYWKFTHTEADSAGFSDACQNLLNRGIGYEYENFCQDLKAHQCYFDTLDWQTPLPQLAMPTSLSVFFNEEGIV
ncbi:hypothetical protein BS333_03405 [Vibrio azureus]|uniref:DUF1266 domain-containing protein n=1 Tax=Vibrio azureus NBRC 104587 TaxID=1219077 RepID=U3AXY8_9VIBR|nr:DUF1266 domain-containing protein [Vibrio azureus]AUI85505.1 hypothetical protein BS333_03405 [Vibrio azureus]GAD78092.1 hypothetical protein VAZ01S_122_00030 [Vibrio azureus NBRC 104587]